MSRLPPTRKRRDNLRVVFFRSGRRNTGTPAVPFQSVNSDGWRVTYASPPTLTPDSSPQTFSVSRQGYDTSGSATTYTESMTFTALTRLPYPDQATLTTDQVAISDYIYSTDTVTGATNNSAETSPKPIANWAMTDRRVVGNTIPKELLEVVAFHRNARSGEQVACVEWTISDGTNTVTVRSSSSVVSGNALDKYSVLVYRPAVDVDVSTLANPATLTVNAKVYPWIGAAASVLNSSDQSDGREFSPRTYIRNTSLLAAPVYAYVATVAGGTPTVSTTAATAQANPYGTIRAAIEALQVSQTVTDGCIVRLMSGTHVWNASLTAGTYQTAAELVIERDPDVAKANAILAWGATASYAIRHSWVRIRDMTMVRQGTFTIAGQSSGQVVFENVDLDNGGFNATWISGFTGGVMLGVTITNPGASLLNAGTPQNRLMRGVSCVGIANVEGWLVLGCELSGSTTSLVRGTRTSSGSIAAFNRFSGISTAAGIWSVGASEAVTGAAFVQNLVEYTSATAAPAARVTADSATGNVSHIVVHHNTFTGFFSSGRGNLFYDDGATARTSKTMSMCGNVHCQINHKGDVFDAEGTRLGGWAYLYGVGCRGEFSQFIDAQSGGIGGTFAQAYPGLNASLGTSNSVRNDPLFTSYQGTSSGPTLGAGGGTYTSGGSSPCKARVTTPVLPFDLAGNARSSSAASSGAYE